MVKPKTLADLKRMIKVGSELLVTIHHKPEWEGKLRTVTKVQSGGFFYEQEGLLKLDGKPERLWHPYPKARDLEWLDDYTFAITAGTYTKGAGTKDDPHVEIMKRWVLKLVHGRCEHGDLRYDGAPGCLSCAEKASAVKKKRFEVRGNCEYVIEVEAETADEALAKANKIDMEDWSQAWAPNEVEEIEEVCPNCGGPEGYPSDHAVGCPIGAQKKGEVIS